MRTCVRMTSQGSPHARFRRALASGNPTLVVAAAAELGRLSLAEALAVTLVFLPKEPERYERASVRWHARWCLEVRPHPDEAGLALAALRALPGPAREAAGEAIVELLEARGIHDAARVMAAWLGDG
jgi:hypothetical protein